MQNYNKSKRNIPYSPQKHCVKGILLFSLFLILFLACDPPAAVEKELPPIGSIGLIDPSLFSKTLPKNKAELQRLVNMRISSSNPSPDLTNINTVKITDMSGLFKDKATFNGNISTWDTSNVTNMRATFRGASVFNGDISKWDTSKVTNMYYMFNKATKFNGDISKWDTSKVTDMNGMFREASVFNRDISEWKTEKVRNVRNMFHDAIAFNQNISKWNVSEIHKDYYWSAFIGATAMNANPSNKPKFGATPEPSL